MLNKLMESTDEETMTMLSVFVKENNKEILQNMIDVG